jgi:hypothetical protein
MSLIVIIVFLIAFLLPIIYVVIWNFQHQEQIKKAVENKQANITYSEKLSLNYSPAQKKWTWVIILYLFVMVLICLLLFLAGYRQLVSGLTLFVVLGWLGLMKLGDRIAK